MGRPRKRTSIVLAKKIAYKQMVGEKSLLTSVETYDGERIEDKVARIQHDGEAIKDGAPEIFTERKEGVIAAYNIRTDRFELAADAMDAISKSRLASRDAKPDIGGEVSEGGDTNIGSDAPGDSGTSEGVA